MRAKPSGGYRSGFERSLATNLKRRKVVFQYEPEKLPYVLEKNYIPDFKLANGIFIEAKGVLTPSDRTKMRAVLKDNPGIDIRFVFMDASKKLNKNSKTTYGMWADKNGFQWADGVIPQEWVDEPQTSAYT